MVERCPDKTEVVGPIPTTPTMIEENKNKDKIMWRSALEVFSEISTWIAVPVILAVIGGKALDTYYGSTPWLLAASVVLAFLISAYGIVKAVKKYAAKVIKNLPINTENKK